VQFSRQVLPVLKSECGACHAGSAAPGGFSIESAERLVAGGRHGKAVVPGKSATSTLAKYLTGELKPQMPPNRPLPLDQVALIRRWIDEGGKIDSMTAPAGTEKFGVMRDAMPTKGGGPSAAEHATGIALLPLAVTQTAPVTAVAFSPDGKWVAAGGYRCVRILDPESGAVAQTISGPVDQVLSLAWSSDGKQLAAAGGLSGSYGEVCVWDVPAPPSAAWPKPKVIKGHTETIYSAAWRPGTQELATGSLDKTARIWDAASGAELKVLKDHVDAVLGVAYSADGKWLATGSLDRTVKLYDAATRTKASSFVNPDGVTAVSFGPKSDIVACACDRSLRVWPVKAGSVENPLRGQGEGEAITSLAFSADGGTFAWGAANRRVRIWSGDVANHRREMSDPITDWVYGVSLSPDGKRVAAGTGEGKLYFWNTQDGKLERTVSFGETKR
jgi:WD40 repeat protein